MKIPKMPGKRTLVKPSEQQRSGKLYLPDSVQGVSALEGTLVAVGPDCEMAKVGDEIAFAPYSKYVVPCFDGPYRGYLLINEQDILFYWEEEKKKLPRKQKGEVKNAKTEG